MKTSGQDNVDAIREYRKAHPKPRADKGVKHTDEQKQCRKPRSGTKWTRPPKSRLLTAEQLQIIASAPEDWGIGTTLAKQFNVSRQVISLWRKYFQKKKNILQLSSSI